MIAFKEWQIICEACASGRQNILFRKGGIHEGRDGFSFKHDQFCFFPTRFHNQQAGVREGEFEQQPEWEVGETITVSHVVKVEWAVTLTDWDQVSTLKPFHIWTDETIRERFNWEGKAIHSGSIHAALIRVYELKTPQSFPYTKSLGGCRSWVDVPIKLENVEMTPVISDEQFAEIKTQLSAFSSL